MSATQNETVQPDEHEGMTAYDLATIKRAEEAWSRKYKSNGDQA